MMDGCILQQICLGELSGSGGNLGAARIGDDGGICMPSSFLQMMLLLQYFTIHILKVQIIIIRSADIWTLYWNT